MEKEKGRFHLLGNSHIDLAWLWTIDETYEVYRETFENVLNLMEKYPGLIFCQSMAQMYEWAEVQHPETFRKIKERADEGRWEIIGGTWVEFDCNIPSGESLVRQFLYGKRYFMEKFGVDTQICWLPDSFGYCWTLPQIIAKSGMKYFLTQKLRWNDMSRFIKNIFWWRGLGGFEVLAHQTLGGYNERLMNPNDFRRQLRTLKYRHGVNDLLILFGRGDHGGGPNEEDLENALRWRMQEELLEIKFTTALRYFKMLEMPKEKFSVVDDELYLQFHRGTYTTQAKIKLQNRRAEIMLENAEKLATVATIYGFKYPKGDLREAWKKTLLNQFHDIICGSSIEEVYDECDRDYDMISKTTGRIIRDAAKTIASLIDTRGEGKSIVVFNTLSWDRDGIVEVDLEKGASKGSLKVRDVDGKTVPSQMIKDEKAEKLVFLGKKVPSIGYKAYKVTERKKTEKVETNLSIMNKDGEIILENSKIKVILNKKAGLVTSIYDKVNRKESLAPKGITLQIFEDYPIEGRKTLDAPFDAVSADAWEIYTFQQLDGVKYIELTNPEEVRIVDKGPIKATAEVKYRYRQEGRADSIFKMKVTLYSEMPMLFIDLEIDWHTLHRLAKIAFPFNLKSEYATYEIPYGFIKRRNPLSPEASLSERAKWEVPGQKWIDYTSEDAGYGVSILNNCKYGFDQINNVLRVTLLRSPKHPPKRQDPLLAGMELIETNPTDQGRHEIKLSVYPHKGNWREALTVKKAYEFNYSLITHWEGEHEGDLSKSHSFMRVKPENVILSVMKEAEDSDDVILRFYEVNSEKVDIEASFYKNLRRVFEIDLIERELGELEISNGSLKMHINENEIKTAKVQF